MASASHEAKDDTCKCNFGQERLLPVTCCDLLEILGKLPSHFFTVYFSLTMWTKFSWPVFERILRPVIRDPMAHTATRTQIDAQDEHGSKAGRA